MPRTDVEIFIFKLNQLPSEFEYATAVRDLMSVLDAIFGDHGEGKVEIEKQPNRFKFVVIPSLVEPVSEETFRKLVNDLVKVRNKL